jgi:SAM-dependent methyltransferase
MNLYAYRERFFDYQQVGSLASARAVVPLLLAHLKPRSVLDVGCGAGAWVRAWLDAGCANVVGVDGSYVQPQQLLFAPSRFQAVDVSAPFDAGRGFDLVQCLEVGEHLDPSASETLVRNLVAHAPVVLFSAAPPGQGGEHHVNERPYEYWRELFARHDFELFDFVRQRIAQCADVEPWYRYNILLFVRGDHIGALEPAVADTHVVRGVPVADVAPWTWRMRRRALAVLPPAAVTALAGAKHRLFLASHAGARP